MFERLKFDKRMKEQEDAMASVQRRLTALEVQWTDTLDRLKSMMGRIIKERARAVAAAPPDEHVRDEDVMEESEGSSLTPRQQEFQDRIMRRRNRLVT